MKRLIPILVLVLIQFTACTKEKTKPTPPSYLTELEGRVIRHGTNHAPTDSPIMLVLYESTGTHGGWHLDYQALDTIYTDSAGYYKYSFHANPKKNSPGDYFVVPKTVIPQHYQLSDDPNSSNAKYLAIGQKHQINWSYFPHAWLRLHVKNINPQFGDILSISILSDYTFWGPIENEVIFRAVGNAICRPASNLYRNGSWQPLPFEVFIPAFDTAYYYLEY